MTILEERGISIHSDAAAVVIAAMEYWMTQSQEGQAHAVNLFGFDWCQGESEKIYEVRDNYGRVVENVAHDKITFFQACAVKGRFIQPAQITDKKLEKVGCDLCGILSHCTRKIVDDRGGSKDYCNHCLQYNDLPALREKSGGDKECASCSASLCEYHPQRHERKFA
jgi:hypothetical protein